MAGPTDWGAQPVEQPDAGPTAWGAQPVEQVAANFADPVQASVIAQTPPGKVMQVLGAGWSGAKEGFGERPLGMTQDDFEGMQKLGIFRTENEIRGLGDVFRAGAETMLYPAAQIFDAALRTPNAVYHALGDAAVEAGVPRDLVAMPEAFMGSPHPMGVPKVGEMPREAAAETAHGAEPATPSVAAPEAIKISADAVLTEAKNLGVIGDKPSLVEAAQPPKPQRAMAADRTGDDVVRGPEPQQPDAWRQRFEQFVGKIDKPEDIQQLIVDAADANNDFPEARQGEIRLSQVESVSEAAGVPSAELTEAQREGIGRFLNNDARVRTAMQAMLKLTEDVKDAARNVKADQSPENLIKLQETMMRRDMGVEQVVGLRAEWGRTGNVFQEFLRDVKDQQGLSDFLKQKGRTPQDLVDIAHMVDTLEPGQAARFLHEARTPTFWDKYIYYWVNSLISGPITHAKYVLANGAFGAYEAGVVTPIAGAIGAAREAITGTADRVYMGEAAARTWGLLAGTPDALRAAFTAARKNIQVPLPAQVVQAGRESAATGISPEVALARINPFTQTKPNPIGGKLGTIVGLPSRNATAIHSFFNFLGYRAELEAQAYRAAAKEGHSPTSDTFWQRRQQIASNPTDEMMEAAVKNGYHLTFISEQGALGKAISRLANTRLGESGIQPFKLIFPFTHIPGNIMKAAMEQTPGAFIDTQMRADLLGKNGAVARDTAYARIVAGSTLSAMVVNWAINDRVTGYGPTDQKERALWLRTHEPYSIRVGNTWVSMNKFGPLGDLMGVVANLTEVGPKVKEGEYTEAAGQVTKAWSHLLTDEVGMQGLANLVEAMDDPDNKAARFLSSMASSNLPYSSMQRQIASVNDPYIRQAKTFVDGIRNAVPFARQDLLPKRDWLGQPLDNPAYHTLLRSKAVNSDPIDLEMQHLDIKPTPPQDRIGGVKLTPAMYDEYQATAGPMTRMLLEKLVGGDGWYNLPPYVRSQTVHSMIESSRKQAAVVVQLRHPELIAQGMQQRVDYINGTTHTARPKKAPEIVP